MSNNPYHSGKQPNQGSPGKPPVQPPMQSGRPVDKSQGRGEPGRPAQDKRGFKTPGKGGSGTSAGRPAPNKFH